MIPKFKRFYNVDNSDVTPPPPVGGECFYIVITAIVPENLSFNITPCGGSPTAYVLNSSGTSVYEGCTESINSQPTGLGTKYTINVTEDPCP